MEKRALGTSEIKIAPLAFGGNVFGWTVDRQTGFQLLDAFVDQGFSLLDTANVYSAWVPGHQGGESETMIGKWFRASGKREQIILATKVGMTMGDGSKGLRKAYILKAAEASLQRLQTDYIDLYQSHCDDSDTPFEETLEAYQLLIQQGKVRAIGASNHSARRLKESLTVSSAHALPHYVCLQPEYNLYNRTAFEAELEPLCTEEKMGVISYSSLASGFLTGKYRSRGDFSKSPRGKGMESYLNSRGFRILDALDQVASNHQCTPAAIALAWIIQRPSVTAPIVSATGLKQFSELASAVTITLSSEELMLLNKASDEKKDDFNT